MSSAVETSLTVRERSEENLSAIRSPISAFHKMQIQTSTGGGTVSVTNGSNLVYSQAGIDWSQVARGCWFGVAGDGVIYSIAADPVLTGDVWEIQLNANFAGPTDAAASYIIHKDFASNGAPILVVGDTELYALLNRWMQASSSGIGGGGGASGLITKQIPITGALIGATEVYCSFTPELSAPPSWIARPIFQKVLPADGNVDAISIDTVSKFGCSINLSGPAVENQILYCAWIPSTGTPPPPPPPSPAAEFVLLSESGATLLDEAGAFLHPENSNPTLE